MNAYFKLMNAKRKSGAASFTYNGSTYVQAKTKSGMIIYKKAGSKSSTKKTRRTSRKTSRRTSRRTKRKSRKKRKSRSRK